MKALIDRALSDGARDDSDHDAPAAFVRTLRSIRKHLGMEVAFISEFDQGRRYFRHVDTEPEHRDALPAGASARLEDTFCHHIAEGRLPELLQDASADPVARLLAENAGVSVGAHLGVPIRLADGSLFGTFCCFSSRPDHTLDARDLDMMRVFADVVADQIDRDRDRSERRQIAADRIETVLRTQDIEMVYQPIIDLERQAVVGFEALSRFAAAPLRAPDAWFAEAAGVGRRVELEALAIRLALRALGRLPRSVYVSVNASPATVADARFAAALGDAPLDRVVVEVTEHEAVERYEDLVAAVRPLQERGLRIAIDDAGAGYASFRHILNLAPHMIKLDVSITRGIDHDRSRRALAAALCRFAEETGCRIVAEGVETADELATLRALGFESAQGYFLGRPITLDHAVALCAAC